MYDSIIVENGEIQTRLRGAAADGSMLPIGYTFAPGRLTQERLAGSGYIMVLPPVPGAPIRLLDVWSGPEVERWAMLEIAGGALRAVALVDLDRPTLESANYIHALNAELLARTLDDESDEHAVDVLRRRLPS